MLHWCRNRVVCFRGAAFAVLFLLVGCAMPYNRVFYQDVNVMTWQQRAVITFSYDEEPRYGDMDLLLHVNGDFEPRDLNFEITVISPDSLRYTECISVPQPVRHAATSDHVEDIKIPYRQDVELAKRGEYTVEIMPLTPLSGVESVGVNFQLK